MSKKNLLKVLDNSSYVSIVCGALLILLFEFFAKLLLLKFAIVLFGASFLMLVVLSSMKLYYMNTGTMENDELLVDKAQEKKALLIVKLVLSSLLFATMIVFLCIY